MSDIQLIVGLGNPGPEYQNTRHNAGSWVVEQLARQSNIPLKADNKFFGFTKIVIEQPLTKDGKILKDKKGKYKTDPNKRDVEKIELIKNIDEYLEGEVKPNVPDFFVDHSKNQIGYEINFTKYFYKFEPLRNLDEISKELNLLNEKIHELTKDISE